MLAIYVLHDRVWTKIALLNQIAVPLLEQLVDLEVDTIQIRRHIVPLLILFDLLQAGRLLKTLQKSEAVVDAA